MEPTYVIVTEPRAIGGLSITWLVCGTPSPNPNDVRERYCPRCHVLHEDEALRRDLAGKVVRGDE